MRAHQHLYRNEQWVPPQVSWEQIGCHPGLKVGLPIHYNQGIQAVIQGILIKWRMSLPSDKTPWPHQEPLPSKFISLIPDYYWYVMNKEDAPTGAGWTLLPAQPNPNWGNRKAYELKAQSLLMDKCVSGDVNLAGHYVYSCDLV